MKPVPSFAVVGHPNKGKSSIVSTLSRNDKILISSRSGTTQDAEVFNIDTANGRYKLIDTPGFQRPNKVLHWLQQHCSNASDRAATVAKFVNDSECKTQFPDEVRLLHPIIDGAAILYVVDGSRPFGAEYETEMEILRWTGQPSMALINPIENSDHFDQWHSALAQYFKTVRVFNPMTADFEKQTELLRTFGHLHPTWKSVLESIVSDLVSVRAQQRTRSIDILVNLITDLCQYRYCQKVLSEHQAKILNNRLLSAYKMWMAQREKSAIDELMSVYGHSTSDVLVDKIGLPADLFDCEKWFAWGLDKKQLTYAAATTGAVGGAAIDAAVAGHSFMLGAIGGGLMGAGSAWFGADKLVDLKLKGLPLGGYQACVGPIKNRNFPYVVIGRFLHLFNHISCLNHANRNDLVFAENDFQAKVDSLQKSSRNDLHKACERLIKQKPNNELAAALAALFMDD